MRICLVAHGFPPTECTGVEGYTSALAAALAKAGHRVEVFAPRRAPDLPNLSMRREEREGFGLTWITTNVEPSNPQEMLDLPGVAVRFGDHLDHEKPEVIHFQHLIKLGLNLLEEAKSRGIPCIYTAHDYYSVCHRVTLMRPDMQRCDVLGDSKACARCDLAVAFLNQQDQLGDYQLGALEAQLEPKRWRQLASVLDGKPGAAGFSDEDQAALHKTRKELDDRRRKVYSRFDLILSPTRFLRERMVEGGLPKKRIEILTYGAETRDLADLPRAAHRPGKALRFGYLGGLAKQKGIHVLLEAFGRLEAKATLSIWGASSDSVYVKQIMTQAKQVGAKWMGAFERPQLRAALEQIDVVVVPSIWVENYPFVIREALAAGRPVIASDVGALSESVRHEKDGLLFAPGNIEELTSAMQRCMQEPGLLEELVAGIGPIKSIEEQVLELEPIYARLVSSRKATPAPNLPLSLHKWEARYAELTQLPQRDLFRRVLERLSFMSRALRGDGEKRAQAPLSADALANYSKAQMLLRDLKRERVWLKTSVEDHEQSDKALRKHVSWREEELGISKKEVLWLNQTVTQREEESQWLKDTLDESKKEVDWLKKTLTGKEEELQWLRQSLEEANGRASHQEKELEWVRASVETSKINLSRYEEELKWLRDSAEEHERKASQRDEELRWLRESNEEITQEASRLAEEIQWLRQSLEAKKAETDWLRQSLEDQKSRQVHDLYQLETHLKATEEEMAQRMEQLQVTEQYAEQTREQLKAKAQLAEQTAEQLKVSTQRVEKTTEKLHASEEQLDQATKKLLSTQERLSQRIEHLLATEEQLGITAEQLRNRKKDMQAVALEARQHFLIKRTALGKRLAEWSNLIHPVPGEDKE